MKLTLAEVILFYVEHASKTSVDATSANQITDRFL